MLPEDRFFLIRGEDDQEYGPVGLEELREWVRENRAGLGSEVRRDESGSSWQPWQNYPELVALLAEVRGTSGAVGVPVGLTIAPMWRRVAAFVLDLIFWNILTTPIVYTVMTLNVADWQSQIIALVLDPQNQQSPTFRHYVLICNVVTYLILLAYLVGFYVAHGKTPGKALMGLRVVDETGQKPAASRILLRGLAFVVSLYVCGFPFLWVFLSPERRAPHDFMAGTWVVEA